MAKHGPADFTDTVTSDLAGPGVDGPAPVTGDTAALPPGAATVALPDEPVMVALPDEPAAVLPPEVVARNLGAAYWSVDDCRWATLRPELPDHVVNLLAPPIVVGAVPVSDSRTVPAEIGLRPAPRSVDVSVLDAVGGNHPLDATIRPSEGRPLDVTVPAAASRQVDTTVLPGGARPGGNAGPLTPVPPNGTTRSRTEPHRRPGRHRRTAYTG